MRRRSFVAISAAAPILMPRVPASSPLRERGAGVVWKMMAPGSADVPALDGYTDTVPDILGRLGAPIDLAIFTEGNHFPALLGGEIIEPFRAWARSRPQYAGLEFGNIVIVTLPQPVIVGMVLRGGISLGSLTIEVSRAHGFYPDIVMGGAAPLKQLRQASIVGAQSRVFARNLGLSLLVAAGNPRAVHGLDDLPRLGIRIVMASGSEPGARRQYIAALEALVGGEATRSILAREVVTFPGRLGIQHRDVLQAITCRYAEVGIIFHHLARYFAAAYPELCTMVTVPGADKFSSTIAMVSTVQPPRAKAAEAFSEFFLGVAREVYPRYGFAVLDEAEFGAPVELN